MKNLYSKFTKERDPKFQQLTQIYVDEKEIKVSKRALMISGIPHIKKMYENYEHFLNKDKDYLCPCTFADDILTFTYLKDESLCDRLLKVAEANNYDKFINELIKYRGYIYQFGEEEEVFSTSEEFEDVFGEVDLNQKKGSKYLNIDLTFDNLISHNDIYKVIDFEWIFPFTIPFEFVFYRAIYGFYTKYAAILSSFIKLESIYDIFGIDVANLETYAKMDITFLDYVYGKKVNYDKNLIQYKKQPITFIKKSKLAEMEFYFDVGEGFSQNQCTRIERNIEPEEVITQFVRIEKNVEKVRFDPGNTPCLLFIHEINVKDKYSNNTRIIDYATNATAIIEDIYYFNHCDPQIVIKLGGVFASMEVTFSMIKMIPNGISEKVISFYEEKSIKDKKMRDIYLEIIHSLRNLTNFNTGKG